MQPHLEKLDFVGDEDVFVCGVADCVHTQQPKHAVTVVLQWYHDKRSIMDLSNHIVEFACKVHITDIGYNSGFQLGRHVPFRGHFRFWRGK